MTKEELSELIHTNTASILRINGDLVSSELDSILKNINVEPDFKEIIANSFASAVEYGALTAIKTLIDLSVLDISE